MDQRIHYFGGLMENTECSEGFCGIGQWEGVAEVFDGQGRFLGNGADQRHVRTQTSDGRIRIDLSFVGPLKFAGHYFIQSENDRRLYQGPANCGYADALGADCVAAHCYWPSTGLSQKFFLMLAPDGQRQMSLALLSRGEQLLYVVVGENAKVVGGRVEDVIPIVNGGTYDLGQDPQAGRPQHLLHREGYWEGEMRSQIDGPSSVHAVRQSLSKAGEALDVSWEGSAFIEGQMATKLKTNAWQAWSDFGDSVGSYSLYGGRALSGQFHHLPSQRRVWRREVVSADGQLKAAVNIWYQGERKLGAEWGILKFRSTDV